MLCKIVFAWALLLELSLLQSNAHQCYICGPLRNGFNMTCEDFELNPSNYEFTCPPNYFSCSTHYEGVNTIRQCERMKKINDCKMANEIKYCYCSADLCNGIKEVMQAEMSQDTDDEDILGETGSGDGSQSATDKQDNINVVIQTVGGNSVENEKENGCSQLTFTASSLCSLIILIATIFIC